MSKLVDVLGAFAGVIWLSGAIYFQMIHKDPIDASYVAAMALIGLSLLMSSSALTITNVRLASWLAIAANVLFIFIGLGACIVLETRADLKERQDPTPDDTTSRT